MEHREPFKLAGTGHRLGPKVGGYGDSVYHRLVDLAARALAELQPVHVYSGMATGWDQALAEACWMSGLPYTAVVPFDGQESKWPYRMQDRYNSLLRIATYKILVSPGGYSPEKMQKRNEWMVDQADMILALWDGSSSGTANAIGYARSTGKQVVNLWKSWEKYR